MPGALWATLWAGRGAVRQRHLRRTTLEEINAQFAAVVSDADYMAESARLMREFAIADRETGE